MTPKGKAWKTRTWSPEYAKGMERIKPSTDSKQPDKVDHHGIKKSYKFGG